MILIFGPQDIHTMRVLGKVMARGEQAVIFNSLSYPCEASLTYDIASPCGGRLQAPGAAEIALSEIKSVYWYANQGAQVYHSTDPADIAYRQQEADAALNSFLDNVNCFWVNPPAAIALHRTKVHQLQLLLRAGLRVPDSLVTNNATALREFYEKHQGRVICKPLYQGTFFHLLSKEDLEPERLERLALNPLLFQEYIEGVDIRVNMVGECPFASEIQTEHFYYKTSEFELKAIAMPASVLDDCRRAMQCLSLVLGGIDLRRTAAGEFVFFEVNPSPQYLVFEDRNHYPITETLVDLLIQPSGPRAIEA